MDHITIVDYGMGNLGSIQNMLKHLGVKSTITSDAAAVRQAKKLILSGVGAFDNGMKNLHDLGLISELENKVLRQKTPLLGICLGMQLLSRKSEEGTRPGLGWVGADTVRFRITDSKLKVPHMGWNLVQVKKNSGLFHDIPPEPQFYFVHSYHVVCDSPDIVASLTVHGYEFVSAIEQNNIMGVQFHPEKSHKFGMKVLQNFAQLSC